MVSNEQKMDEMIQIGQSDFRFSNHMYDVSKGGPGFYTGYVNVFKPVGLTPPPSPPNKVCFGPKRYVSMMGSSENIAICFWRLLMLS